MSEIEIDTEYELENDDYGPRFSKALFGRILAVGLFVVLGTLVIILSMKNKPKPQADGADPANANFVAGNDSNKITSKNSLSTAGSIGTTSGTQETENVLLAAARLGSAKIIPSPYAGKPKLTQTKPAPFNSKPKPSFEPNGFGANKTPVAKSASTIKASKPVVPKIQPTRFAQGPGGVPLTNSQGGFRAGAPVVDATGFKTNVSTTVTQAKDVAQNLKNQAGNVAANAQSKLADGAAALKSGVQKGLGVFDKKPNLGAVPRKFEPPSIPNSFGPAASAKSGSNFKSDLPAINPGRAPNASFNANGPLVRPKAPANNTAAKANPFDNPPARNPLPPIRKVTPPAQNGFGGQKSTAAVAPFNSQATSRAKIPAAQGSTARPAPVNNFANRQNTNSNRSNTIAPKSLLGSAAPTAMPAPATMLTRNVPGERGLEGIQAPALTVQKLSPREIQVNSTADFEIVIKNVGRVAAENVRVFDQVPDGAQFISSNPEPSRSARSRDIQWDLGSMAPGQEKRIKLQLKPTRPGEMGSVAHVTFATQASMRTLVTRPELEIIHQSEPRHLIGDEVILDVVVKNKGDGPAKNVLIQEDVPVQLNSPIGREIEYEVGTLMPGKSRRVRLALKAAQVGRIKNVMFASAEGGLRAEHKIDLEVVAPNLTTKADGPTIRYLKRNVSHTFSVANNGTAPATNVELIARLPSGLRYISANNQGTYAPASHSVFWSLAELSEDVEAKVELKTTPIEVGSQPIKFEALADLNIKSEANQPLNVEHLVDVFFDIDDVVDPIEIGSGTSYKVRVVNQGTKAATNVQLQVDFPPGLTPTSIDGSLRHTIRGQQIAFEPIASMTPGDEINFIINATGRGKGDHRVVVNMRTDGRQTPVSKEETTRVYSDR